MSGIRSGQKAEQAAANYLESRRFQILETNWRTPWCEIDIIACKEGIVLFTEVKYRSDSLQGTGFDYITPKKITQMGRAAESWVQQNKWTGPYQLAAIEVEGPNYTIQHFIDNV